MEVSWVVKSSWLAIAALLVSGYGGGSDAKDESDVSLEPSPAPTPVPAPASVSVNGAVQKGPFVVGTPVFVNTLDAVGNASEATVITEVKDSIGAFSFNISSTGPVQIISSGYYYSELTGQISAGSLTLKAIYEVSDSNQQTAFVNILTHLTNDRILKLIKDGSTTVRAATTQAQTELVSALNPVLPTTVMPDFSRLSIYNVNEQNQAGNGYLLALSTAFYKYGEIKWKKIQADGGESSSDAQLALILNVIAKDFADDGLIQTDGFITDLTTALRSSNPHAVMQHLRERSSVDYSEPVAVPDISQYFGLCAGVAECEWSARAPLPQGFVVSQSKTALHAGKVFVIGRQNLSNGSLQKTAVYAYDVESNNWSAAASTPGLGTDQPGGPTEGMELFDVSGRLFVAVWAEGVSIYEYDDAANTWNLFTDVPGAAATSVPVTSFEGKLFFFSHKVSALDIATKTWFEFGSLPEGHRWDDSNCRVGDNVYFMRADLSNGVTRMHSFNLVHHTWSDKAPISRSIRGTACAGTNGKLYLLGGESDDGTQFSDRIDIYSIIDDDWRISATRLPMPLSWADTIAIGSSIYVIDGVTRRPYFPSPLVTTSAVNVLDTSLID